MCEEQTKGYKGAIYKKFPTRSAADDFLKEHIFGSKKNDQYKPEDHTVPLGKNVKDKQNQQQVEKQKQVEDVNKESEDLWPPSDGDDFITDEDLV